MRLLIRKKKRSKTEIQRDLQVRESTRGKTQFLQGGTEEDLKLI